MSYVDPRYVGEKGEVSAVFRPADQKPELTIGSNVAVRYLATDGRGKKAIVVCGDIAEYERGSSGEQTQGAGTVAFLIEENPKLCRIDLAGSGSSSDYRGLDFRKPVGRHFVKGYAPKPDRYADFPVFNGKYSTFCYLDAVTHAASAMFERTGFTTEIAQYSDDGFDARYVLRRKR